jgi:hypothetical protein
LIPAASLAAAATELPNTTTSAPVSSISQAQLTHFAVLGFSVAPVVSATISTVLMLLFPKM